MKSPTSSETTIRPRYSDITSFFRLERSIDAVGADIALLGVPWDGGTTNRPGARHAPREVRAMSSFIRRIHPITLASPFERSKIFDLGDASVNPVDLVASLKLIQSAVAEIVSAGALPIVIGGDHLVTLPVFRAIAAKRPLGLIHFDAHSDTWDSYFGDSRYTHGTTFRRAVEEGLLDPKRTVQIGIRGSLYFADDLDFARESGMRIITAEECRAWGPTKVTDIALATVGDHPTYLSFDIDCLDPAFAPGTGTPEIGGFSSGEALDLLRALQGVRWAGADVVEVSPPFDSTGNTALVAATLLFEIICLLADRRR